MAFSDYEKDVLRETGNIGSGNAVTVLSKLISNELIDLNVPEIHLMNPNMMDALHPEETFTVHSKIMGDLNGCISFHFTKKEAMAIIRKMTSNILTEELDDLGKDTLMEVGNIMSNSYIASIGKLLGFDLMGERCLLCEDKDASLQQLRILGENLVKLNTIFSVYDEEEFSKIWFLLDDPSVKKILSRAVL